MLILRSIIEELYNNESSGSVFTADSSTAGSGSGAFPTTAAGLVGFLTTSGTTSEKAKLRNTYNINFRYDYTGIRFFGCIVIILLLIMEFEFEWILE